MIDEMAWALSNGDITKRDRVLHETPLRDVFAAYHCWLYAAGVECVQVGERGRRMREAEGALNAAIAAAKA